MNTPEIVQHYLAMDGLGITTDGLLISLDDSIADKMPRLLVLNHEQGYSLFPRHNLSAHLRGALIQLSPELAFHDHEKIKAILAADAPCPEVWIGRSYTFPALRAEDYPSSVVRLSETQRDLIVKYNPNLNPSQVTACAILSDGQIASSCVSSRENNIGGGLGADPACLPAARLRLPGDNRLGLSSPAGRQNPVLQPPLGQFALTCTSPGTEVEMVHVRYSL